MNSGIYKIINIVNNKCYYGSSKNLDKRKKKHFKELSSNKHKNNHLQKSYNKHGEENFLFECIEPCEVKNLMNIEQQYLDQFWDGGIMCYNIAKFASAPMRERKHSQETKDKLSKAMSGENGPWFGKSLPEEVKIKIGNASRGRTVSKENKKSLSNLRKKEWNDKTEQDKSKILKQLRWNAKNVNGMKNKQHTEETKEKLSKTIKEKYKNGFASAITGVGHTKETIEKIKKTKSLKNKNLLTLTKAKIIELYEKNISINSMAKILGVSTFTVKNRIKEFGLKR